jgi:GalNAc-alpha-(1->4)-GalNAc-alpha-(1->3)-diNAcBac-PP-undecaprenol alpha-1,4-N-acetyl-D-galactosaminyltransferase
VSEGSTIAILIHSLSGGGSEHSAARLATHWAALGREVTLITLDEVAGDTIAIHEGVRRVGLGLLSDSTNFLSAIFANRRRVLALRSAIVKSKATRVISLTDRMNVLTILACRGTGLRPIVAERTDPRHHRIGPLWSFLRRRTYPKAGTIVVQTESVRKVILPLAGRCPVVVLPNAVSIEEEILSYDGPVRPSGTSRRADTFVLDADRNWICGVGRLSIEKGFDRLIAGFAEVAESHPDWNLVIVGDGPTRRELELQITGFGLADRVLLAGWIEQPWPVLRSAEVFVLPSRYEGFPNALLEAMARGKACVAADCQSGPAEIIRPGENGLLCDGENDEEFEVDLGKALHSLLSGVGLRASLGENARKVQTEFSTARHFQAWDAIEV